MKKNDKYLSELRAYSKLIITTNLPKGNTAYKQGSIKRLQSFFEDYERKLKIVSDKILEKANDLMKDAKKESGKEDPDLRQKLLDVSQELIRDWIAQSNK